MKLEITWVKFIINKCRDLGISSENYKKILWKDKVGIWLIVKMYIEWEAYQRSYSFLWKWLAIRLEREREKGFVRILPKNHTKFIKINTRRGGGALKWSKRVNGILS